MQLLSRKLLHLPLAQWLPKAQNECHGFVKLQTDRTCGLNAFKTVYNLFLVGCTMFAKRLP